MSTESPSGVLAASAGPGTGAGADGGTGPKLALAVDVADADGPVIDVTRLRVALARLSRRLRRHELAGVTPTQLAALATVGHSGPMRLGDLAAAEGIAPSTLTRLVTALEDSGYVRRCADPSDARASTLAITAHGQNALERIRRGEHPGAGREHATPGARPARRARRSAAGARAARGGLSGLRGLRGPATRGLRGPATPGLRGPATPGLRGPATPGLRGPATPGRKGAEVGVIPAPVQ